MAHISYPISKSICVHDGIKKKLVKKKKDRIIKMHGKNKQKIKWPHNYNWKQKKKKKEMKQMNIVIYDT